jgi:hypothetical protein
MVCELLKGMVTGPFTLLSWVNSCNRVPVMVNMLPDMELSAPQRLAIAHAPKISGACLLWLLRFDLRLQGILQRAKEPMIAQLRFAWWRDVLAKAMSERPSGEPLLAELARLEHDPVQAAQLLVDSWELMVGEVRAGEHETLAAMRAEAIFGSYARWVNCSEVERQLALALGLVWAGQGNGPHKAKPRKLRPLSILAFSAHLEREPVRLAGLWLSWHALTGR